MNQTRRGKDNVFEAFLFFWPTTIGAGLANMVPLIVAPTFILIGIVLGLHLILRNQISQSYGGVK